MKKAALNEAHVRHFARACYLLSAIESDLEVLGSQLCPDLHEINTQLNQLRHRIEQDPLDEESEEDGDPPQDDEPPSSEA